MINKNFFFKGNRSIFTHDSPAIALTCCFIAIGALFKNLGFNIQESIFSTVVTYALRGSLVMAESMLIGASLLNIFSGQIELEGKEITNLTPAEKLK